MPFIKIYIHFVWTTKNFSPLLNGKTLREKPLKTVIYSTAEWTKFSPTVLNALKQDSKKYSDKEALEEISSKFGASLPQSIKNLFNAKIK